MAVGDSAASSAGIAQFESLATMATTELVVPAAPMRGTLRVPRGTWLVALLLVTVGWLIVPPLAILVYGSATDTAPAVAPHFTFDTLRYAFGRPRIWWALANSAL